MTCILCIETATEVCSVALSVDGIVQNYRETTDQNSHSEKVTVFIEELLLQNKLQPTDIDAVAISKGPGSYTGLRIGTSTAKGLCYALEIPLIALSTLKVIANGALSFSSSPHDRLMPMIDARRMEVYTALFNPSLMEVDPTKSTIIDENTFDINRPNKLILCGNGVEKCAPFYQQYSHVVVASKATSARFMADLAQKKYNEGRFEDVAYFDPFYLKDYIAAQSYVKGLR